MSLNVRYVSKLERSGYGVAGLANVRALLPLVDSLDWRPIMSWRGASYRMLAARPAATLARSLFDVEAPIVDAIDSGTAPDAQVLHTVPELWSGLRAPGVPTFGYTVWETDALPRHWQRLIAGVDATIVPCAMNQPLFADAGGGPVHVVPHACRESCMPPAPAELEDFRATWGIPGDRYAFYSVNAWNPRKALWDVINAYQFAFDASDPVVLVIKTDPEGQRNSESIVRTPVRSQLAKILANYPDPAPVVLIDRSISDRDMELLHFAGNAYVSMARSEGWGLGMFDAAWFGNPVISTGWGGQLDYLDGHLCTLLDYRLEPVVFRAGEPSYTRDQRWARPNMDTAVDAMRDHVSHPGNYAARAAELSCRIASEFNSAVVGRKLFEALSG